MTRTNTTRDLTREHRRRVKESDRLLAAADVAIERRERVIERVRRTLVAA